MSVNKERVALWVGALRSGDYGQTSGVLARQPRGEDKFRFCCLGVACEVAIAQGAEVTVSQVKDMDGNQLRQYDRSSENLPDSVANWFGFEGVSKRDPEVNHPYECPPGVICDHDGPIKLSFANDELCWTFHRIANAIEASYLTGEGNVETT